MLSTSDITALVALVVSLIALVVTATQLSAQLFQTAEGARKCSKSVLGPWSSSRKPDTRTRWNWRWSEGRYETLYVAPELSLSSSLTWYPPPGSATTKTSELVLKDNVKDVLDQLAPSVKRSRSKSVPDAVLGADDDLDNLLFQDEYQKHGTDKVGWIDFLTFLRLEMYHQSKDEVVDQKKWTWNTANRREGPRTIRNSQVSWPKIKYVLHSWDFMPADCPKPLASSTVGDIAVIVRRTGMVWKEFKPGEGRMSAEGGPHVINSMEQRGLGIVLQYRCLDDTLLHNVRETRKRREARQKNMNTTTQQKSEEAEKCGSFRKRLSKVEPRAMLQIKDEETGADNGSGDMRKEDVAINHGIKEKLQRFWRGMSSEEDREGGGEEEEEEEEEGTSTDMSDTVTHWNPLQSMNLNQDKIMFGWIPSDPALNIPDFPHATPKECSDVLVDLTGDSRLHDFVERNGRDDFNDLLYLAPEAFHQRGRDKPILQSRDHLASMFYSSIHLMVKILNKCVNGKKIAGKELGKTYIGIERMRDFSQIFTSIIRQRGYAPHQMDLDLIHNYHEETTKFFRNFEKEHDLRHHRFHDLLGVHFQYLTKASCEARAQMKRKHGEDWEMQQPIKDRDSLEYELWGCELLIYRELTLELYFSYVFGPPDFSAPNFVGNSWERTEYRWRFEEAWLMLMLRGFSYRELHEFSEDSVMEGYLDRKYYNSKIPVWLG